jgi:hypothetical protein
MRLEKNNARAAARARCLGHDDWSEATAKQSEVRTRNALPDN